jgi:hypothetical protein
MENGLPNAIERISLLQKKFARVYNNRLCTKFCANIQVSWETARADCCKLGMDLVEIKDADEMKCLFNINNNNSMFV